MDYKNTDFRAATVKNEDNSTEIYFVHVDSWADFDLLLRLLQQECGCEIISNREMICIRKAELFRSGIAFQLQQDDMLGNFLYTEDDNIVPILEQLANDVINTIKEKRKNL